MKSYKDIACAYGYCPRGEHAFSYNWEPSDDQSRWSTISSVSIEGSQTNFLINTTERSVDSPIEKIFNLSVHGFNIHDIFLECLQSSATPAVACKLFQSCYIHVTDEELAWATR